MSDPQIDRWRLQGEVYLWRFPANTRNYPGWECTADAEGCQSLLDLFALMVDSPYRSTVDIAITAANEAIAALPGGHFGDWLSPGMLQLVYPKGKVKDNCWRWDGGLQRPTLTIGGAKLEALRKAFESVAAYQGDFCIHADDQTKHGLDPEKMAIWFWSLRR